MVERSRFWDGVTLGDATVAPYDAATEFAEVMMALAGQYNDPNKGGVLANAAGGLASSVFAANTLRVAAGQAIVWGTWYENTANLDITIPSPSGSTRVDRIVLRKSWAAQTVRITRIAGAEGGSAPAMVQTAGTTWDVPLSTVSITTGGTMTITDARTNADVWYRTGSASIRTDGNAGVGITPSAWGGNYRALQVGQRGALWADVQGVGAWWSDNLYFDGSDRRALQNAAASELNQGDGTLTYRTAPAVAQGAVQTFTTRLVANNLGQFAYNSGVPDPWTGHYLATPSLATITLTNTGYGLHVPTTLAKSGSTGSMIGGQFSLAATNNGTATSVIASLVVVGPTGTNPGVVSALTGLYISNPTLTGGTITTNNAIQHANTVAQLTAAGVWSSTSHEYDNEGNVFKLRRGLVSDRMDVLAALRAIKPQVYAYASDPDGREYGGVFAEELARVAPLFTDGRSVDHTLAVLALAAAQALLDRVEALEKVN